MLVFWNFGNTLTTIIPVFARPTVFTMPGICKCWQFFLTDFWGGALLTFGVGLFSDQLGFGLRQSETQFLSCALSGLIEPQFQVAVGVPRDDALRGEKNGGGGDGDDDHVRVCVCAGGSPPRGSRSARRAACFKAAPDPAAAGCPRVYLGAARAHGGAGPGFREARRRGGRGRRG